MDVNAVPQDPVLPPDVRGEMDGTDLIIDQVHNVLAPDTNNMMMGLGLYVVTDSLMDRSQTGDYSVFLECVQRFMNGGNGNCRMEYTHPTVDRIGAGM
jgi:hypothetical protein